MKSDPDWLVFLTSLSGPSGTLRMRIWRSLKSMGAVVLRDGVYLLPQRDELMTQLTEQVDVIRNQNGTAYCLNVQTASSDDDERFCTLFDRSEDYAPLLAAVREWQTGLTQRSEAEARRGLRQLQRDFAALEKIDYFPGPSLTQAEQALVAANSALNRQFSPDEPQPTEAPIQHYSRADFQGRTWATRKRLWIDRVASAWLIRRFIDSDARFIWLKHPVDCPKKAIGFDFDGAMFTHVGERITFEVLLASFDLDNDSALARLGAMVHFLDVGGVPAPEAAGFEAILTGVREQTKNDDELLATMTPVLDALYVTYGQSESTV